MTNPADLGFDLLPPDPGIISPDLALDAAVAPVTELDATEEDGIGKGWAYDFVAKDFVYHGAAPAVVYELDEMRVWIEKALRTARAAHEIYTESFGMEDPTRLIGQPPDGATIAAYEDDVVETLTVHDRIAAVDSFYYQHDPYDDALYVSFVVTLDSDPEQVIQVDSFPVGSAVQDD